jgi:F-type H+-transporting ATPase subunit delta
VITTSIAKRYAEGLLKIAHKQNNITEVEEDLFEFVNSIWRDKNIRNFLMHPKLPYKVKEEFLEKVTRGKFNPLTLEFLKFLIKKERINQIVPIVYEFDSLNDRFQGVLKVEVVSAYPVSENFLQKVKKYLEDITCRKVKFKLTVDASMVLGVKIKIGDLVIENSMEYKLNSFFNRIKD